MNLEKALKILKGEWHTFVKTAKGYVQEHDFMAQYEYIYTPRKIINWAKLYTSEGQRLNIKQKVKQERKEKNRHHTKQDIHHERFENFSKNKLRKDGDIWNWD